MTENFEIQRNKTEVGETIENLEEFLKQNIKQIYAVIDAVRHGHTRYTEEYPDLTPEGIQAVNQTADDIVSETLLLNIIANKQGLINFKQDILYVSSENPRARGSNEIIKKKLEDEFGSQEKNIAPNQDGFKNSKGELITKGKPVRLRKTLKSFKTHGPDAIDLLMQLSDASSMKEWLNDEKLRNTDYVYVNSPELEERTDLFEPRSETKKRIMNGLSVSSKVLKRYKEKFQNLPHIIATSHFETLNNLVMDTFNLSREREKDELLERGEKITLYLLQPQDKEHIPMLISFRGKHKKVIFNLATKKFE